MICNSAFLFLSFSSWFLSSVLLGSQDNVVINYNLLNENVKDNGDRTYSSTTVCSYTQTNSRFTETGYPSEHSIYSMLNSLCY